MRSRPETARRSGGAAVGVAAVVEDRDRPEARARAGRRHHRAALHHRLPRSWFSIGPSAAPGAASGPVAHLVERRHGMAEATGSIPVGSTRLQGGGLSPAPDVFSRSGIRLASRNAIALTGTPRSSRYSLDSGLAERSEQLGGGFLHQHGIRMESLGPTRPHARIIRTELWRRQRRGMGRVPGRS